MNLGPLEKLTAADHFEKLSTSTKWCAAVLFARARRARVVVEMETRISGSFSNSKRTSVRVACARGGGDNVEMTYHELGPELVEHY